MLNIITAIADTKELEGDARDDFFATAYASFKTNRRDQDDTEIAATTRSHWDAIGAEMEAQAQPLGKEVIKLLRSNHEARLQSSATDASAQRALFILNNGG